ncbi:phage tail spike protein [Melghirimyces algeriensis]|uniref:Phage minor structural protein, N-terminal region n=1 Tax=Melghirimyces algeriensis TaxID=910412 RepID=A0A521FBP2_9BACL|nr:phage tail spike protein [Melghirimyces algeriensis]SMO93051.1 phage minor structural protein, N-terminal region [Melghirimyces algeriensis]
MSYFKIWILDPNEQIQAVASNRGTALPILDVKHKEQINGENSLEFQVPSDHRDAKHIVENGVIVFRGIGGSFQEFVVREIEESHGESGDTKRIFCEHVSNELMDFPLEKYEANKHDVTTMLSVILSGTRWQVGLVDPTETLTHTFYMKSVMKCIGEIVEKMGVEFRFRVQFIGNKITGRYVDVFYELGNDTGKRFEYRKDMNQVRRVVDTYIPTALVGLGKTTEEKLKNTENEKVTFEKIEWKKENGDPRDKPAGQLWIGDEDARKRYGIPDGKGGRTHRIKFVEFSDIEDPEDLIRETNEELDKAIMPKVTYDMDVIDLEKAAGLDHEAVRLGDTVRVIDREISTPINIKARIVEIDRDLLHPENTRIVLGNFLDLYGPEDDLNKIKERTGSWDGATKPGDKVKTRWLDGIIDALQNEIYGGAGTVRLQNDGMLILDKPADHDPQRAIILNNGVLAISNKRVLGGDPATASGWEWRTFGTGDGFTADLINAGTLNASLVNVFTESGDKASKVTIQNGNVYSYTNGQLSMRYGNYRLEMYDYKNAGGMLGYIGTAYDTSNEEYRGISLIGEKDFITLGRLVNGYIRANFRTDFNRGSTAVIGPGTNTEGSGLYTGAGLYADGRIWQYDSDTPSRGQPCIITEKGNVDSVYISDVAVYVGDLENGSEGKFVVRVNNANTNGYKEQLLVDYNRVYFGTNRVVWVKPYSNAFRMGVGNDNYFRLFDNGQFEIIANNVTRHVFYPNGSKSGGSIEIDGKVWGMSPIDSPQVLIETVIFDQNVTEDGVLVELEERYAKAVSHYGVFPSRGDVVVENKTESSFIVRGKDGVVDLRIVGIRVGDEGTYWREMPTIESNEQNDPIEAPAPQ